MTNSWRTKLLWSLGALAVVVLIIAGFYAEENARGLRAWEQCQRDLAARGESIEWTNFIPAPVPDALNFYKAPMMAEWFIKNFSNNPATDLQTLLQNPEDDVTNITSISASNYIAWSLSFDPIFRQIREATKRPAARLIGDYSTTLTIPTPNVGGYCIVFRTLAHRAQCHLVLRESEKALDDLTLLHGLSRALVETGKSTTPLSVAAYGVAGRYETEAMAFGIQQAAWTGPQLAALQAQLADFKLLPLIIDSFRYERAGMSDLVNLTGSNRSFEQIRSYIGLGWWLLPTGWFYQNKVVSVTLEQRMLDSFGPAKVYINPGKVKAAASELEKEFRHPKPWNFIAAIITPRFSNLSENIARLQTWAEQGQIACALESYRLAKGEYPDTLAALVPQYLPEIPNDVIDGKPMAYVRRDNQHFLLYSVGWNETDDGGTIAHESDGNEDRDHGDWVWHYPTN